MSEIPPADSPSITASADGTPLDCAQVTRDDGPVRLLQRMTGAREPGFSVVIQRSALDAIHAHGQSDTSVEICGVLVGTLCHDRISPYLLISAQIPGEKAASKQTQVTFTAETWNGIQAAMEKDFADRKIVGWYHTHPGFGVFLSGMDLFIQDNFFNLPWQVAWVYDPIAGTDGVFVWREGKTAKIEFLIEEDAEETSPASRQTPSNSTQPPPREKWSNMRQIVVIVAVFMAFFLLAWYASVWLVDHGYRVHMPIEH